jgi:lysophospholipase L1-like esterase
VNARYADVAASENASFCDIHAPLEDDGRGALRGDGLHLTLEGYAILAATLARCRIRSV